MSNTYSQIHIHCIFAVKYRQALIAKAWKQRLHQYITGIVQNHQHKMIAINSMPDHLHIFFGMRPHQSLAELMRIVKGDSSEWVNANNITHSPFRWQEGYGAFSCKRSDISQIATYIENQVLHHQMKTFLEEYIEFLDDFGIEFNNRYIFKLAE